jgi:hypothetical protein
MFDVEHGSACGQPESGAAGLQSCTSFVVHCVSQRDTVMLLD